VGVVRLNRREFLYAAGAGVSVVVPYNDAPPRDVEDIDEPVLTYSNPNHETGRTLERYELRPRDGLRVQWLLRDQSGHASFREEYPFSQLDEFYRQNAAILRFYSPPPAREQIGHTYLSTAGEYAYHHHVRGDATRLYREHIDTGDYELIE